MNSSNKIQYANLYQPVRVQVIYFAMNEKQTNLTNLVAKCLVGHQKESKCIYANSAFITPKKSYRRLPPSP